MQVPSQRFSRLVSSSIHLRLSKYTEVDAFPIQSEVILCVHNLLTSSLPSLNTLHEPLSQRSWILAVRSCLSVSQRHRHIHSHPVSEQIDIISLTNVLTMKPNASSTPVIASEASQHYETDAPSNGKEPIRPLISNAPCPSPFPSHTA